MVVAGGGAGGRGATDSGNSAGGGGAGGFREGTNPADHYAPAKSPFNNLAIALPALNIPIPKSATISVTLPTMTPILVIILANLFCPSSELVKAVLKATRPITNAPIPVPIIATLKLLNPVVNPLIDLPKFFILEKRNYI